MKIGDASTLSDVPTKTIRYYEDIGLIGPAKRIGNGYRDYDETDVEALCLIRQMRHVGFSVDECRQLLDQLHHGDEGKTTSLSELIQWKEKLAERISDIRVISQILRDEAEPWPPFGEGMTKRD